MNPSLFSLFWISSLKKKIIIRLQIMTGIEEKKYYVGVLLRNYVVTKWTGEFRENSESKYSFSSNR